MTSNIDNIAAIGLNINNRSTDNRITVLLFNGDCIEIDYDEYRAFLDKYNIEDVDWNLYSDYK